ncbi:MAG: helicase-associated domain-containing protein, partial [Thermocrispum sp.]
LGYDGHHHWTLLEGRYTLAVVFEYAGTLGLVDLEYVRPEGARDDYRDNWGGDWLDALSRYDGLQAVRLTPLGAYATGRTDAYRPADADSAETTPLKVLPNLDIVATGTVSAADRLVLSAYAKQTGDHVWTVSAATLLTAIDAGRDIALFTTFLTQRCGHDFPDALATVAGDAHRRAAQLTDLGHIRVIECTDSALAALIANNRALSALCRPLGDRHLAVPLEHEPRFRKALLKLGYVLPRQPAH